jgi:hypothetical protein
MAIGRTDERRNPLIPAAIIGRAVVWMSLADPIWASGQASRVKGRTHDRIRTNASILKTYLNPTGRPHMVLGAKRTAVGIANPLMSLLALGRGQLSHLRESPSAFCAVERANPAPPERTLLFDADRLSLHIQRGIVVSMTSRPNTSAERPATSHRDGPATVDDNPVNWIALARLRGVKLLATTSPAPR